jgi:hypothetical protein
MGFRVRLLLTFVTFVCVTATPSPAADTLPDRIADGDYWKLISTLSEESGTFQSENLLSNEVGFPEAMIRLKQAASPDGVYIGVGPEQNFNYIAAIHPKIAFIIDIRRQNMLEHLMYKALFEMSPDRATFISHLFSRPLIAGPTHDITAAELFDAYTDRPADNAEFEENLEGIRRSLMTQHRFALTRDDWRNLASVYAAFRDFGPLIEYSSRGGGPSGRAYSPSYARLMTETDSTGREWSYLATEGNYRTVRDLESRNLIVPLTGDFGGLKAIRAVGKYVKDHGAVVSAFYVSNVEGYLFRGGDRMGNPNGGAERFYDSVATLPLDDRSTFIRWIPGYGSFRNESASIYLAPIIQTLDDFTNGRLTAADLLRGRRFVPPSVDNTVFRRRPPTLIALSGARSRTLFYSFVAIAAFLIRYFVWSAVVGNERFFSRERIVYSLLWAAAGLVLAVGLSMLLRI